MQKSLLTLAVASLVVLSGCGADGKDRGSGLNNNTNPRMNVSTQYYNEDDRSEQDRDDFGFTRVNNTTGENDNTDITPSIDREQLADIISRLSQQIPDVNDVSTLVTDEEVFNCI
ncbi:YhcN/YlaJ family sporulation lipoprotein [Bacillus sp. V5-8f]|uniref:YhcN/YlaJ family sporulation lipoprotein n=1 Tax=Bacillus sp. V5-8f TaxID=2053044 RepID=UPI00115AE877|nr:YhcN/YlaJ family sporulation lipoprotein [Bacillus sp. V5-8f]